MVTAQQDGSRGLFGRGGRDGIGVSGGVMNQTFGATGGDVTNQTFGGTHGGVTNQTFGETPLSSGMLILLVAGAGYATARTKRKNNKQHIKP
jgi:hypothetical protein